MEIITTGYSVCERCQSGFHSECMHGFMLPSVARESLGQDAWMDYCIKWEVYEYIEGGGPVEVKIHCDCPKCRGR